MATPSIRKISLEESHSLFPSFVSFGVSPTVLGLFENNSLMTAVRFNYPVSKSIQADYTCEISGIWGSNADYARKLVDHYIKNFYPADIYLKDGQSDEGVGQIFQNKVAGGSEWRNSSVTYYTYRITASDSDKYYYGVSHVKKANATVEDCRNDGYFGSGSNYFQRWKNKHKTSLVKDVLSLFAKRSEAYAQEKILVGDLWRSDDNCLNRAAGGAGKFAQAQHLMAEGVVNLQICKVHGEAKHKRKVCYRCQNEKTVTVKSCRTHGLTKHQGDSCCSCTVVNRVSIGYCEIHGKTPFKKNKCYSCFNRESFSLKNCITHGLVKHQGNSCRSCISDKRKSNGICQHHGAVIFLGKSCPSCANDKAIAIKECPLHGLVKHRGDNCYSCLHRRRAHKQGGHRKIESLCPLCIEE